MARRRRSTILLWQLRPRTAERGNMHSRIILGVGILGLVGCGVFGSDDTSTPPAAAPAPPGSDPVAAADGGLPEGAPLASVGTPMPDELTSEFGVFVTTTGTAAGDGTKEHPLLTISAGIDKVKDLKLRVYVCAGTYAESLMLVNAVSVIGSLGCDGGEWAPTGGRSILNAPTSPAVRAKDIALSTRFEGFDVTAPAGTAAAPNSIALIAENAPMLTVAKSKFTSAKAFDGADGSAAVQLTAGTTLTGADGSAFSSGLANPFTGPQQHLGGAGGVGSCLGAPAHNGENGKRGGSGATEICTKFFHLNTGLPGWHWDLYSRGGVGYNRSDGVVGMGISTPPASNGASASTYGSFTPQGYAPVDGTAGSDGVPGHGGSGGNGAPTTFGADCTQAQEGNIIYDATGPGGGAGGCPGLAGTAGRGGGASIAALVFASPGLSLTTCELVAGGGGNAGKGAFPSAPTFGGNAGVTPIDATAATAGGPGGQAGFSGNGSGGPSIALAYTGGDIVVAQDTHLTPATAGAGVPVRSTVIVGATVTIPAGASGPSMATLAF